MEALSWTPRSKNLRNHHTGRSKAQTPTGSHPGRSTQRRPLEGATAPPSTGPRRKQVTVNQVIVIAINLLLLLRCTMSHSPKQAGTRVERQLSKSDLTSQLK